ncbi:hypothetical protein P280DRAFT_493649 [Massarina eburnea CBS 473.64]|uniref:Uncharacterized protein n=1 Tax=Massarina eburnea CBS 473.64 TaxID=1395130 RepID=A0A6A6RMY3_9PLEO|nr:hypothetical protein P280DRAFT_493649 [Massarina eburnea CBS 473.64]
MGTGRRELFFGPRVPSRNLPFPPNAKITAVELCAFFPNALRSADIVYRLISNGGTRAALWSIVNTHQDLAEHWPVNSCGRIIYKAMRDGGFEGWTVKKHDVWHTAEAKQTWDQCRLDCGEVRVPCEISESGTKHGDIPFVALMENMRSLPTGYDALDLTRCVWHCWNNKDEGWMYPGDYDQLLERIGGPAQVHVEHYDRVALARWERRMPSPPGPPSSPPPPIRRGRPSKKLHLSKDADGDSKEEDEGLVPYCQPPMPYIAPPSYPQQVPDETIQEAFDESGDSLFGGPFSAYAFAGPRAWPPFRHLHKIEDPVTKDVSEWAENLRCVKAQREMFGAAVEWWDESPEHMESITRARIERKWVSAEWLIDFEGAQQVFNELDEEEMDGDDEDMEHE